MSYPLISICGSVNLVNPPSEMEHAHENPQQYSRTYGTLSWYCMDLVNVHFDTNVMNLYRFGAGTDRSFNL